MFDFTTLNNSNGIQWNVDTNGFEYTDIKSVYEKYQNGVIARGFFTTKSKFGKSAVMITDNEFVNLPSRYTEIIEDVLQDNDAVNAIKSGLLTVFFNTYHSKKYDKDGYIVQFTNTIVKDNKDE